jgi:RNA polymerase sigma factor for flagellar operon FliA
MNPPPTKTVNENLILKRRILLDRLENVLTGIDLKEGCSCLTKREKNIINLYYLEGYRDKEIAKIYGVCQQNINRQRKRGIAKIKIINYF